jgi:hypothetical protein
MEFNDKDILQISDWGYIVNDCVKDCNTPTLFIFENVETVKYPENIGSLKLSEDEIADLRDTAYKTTRTARLGRVDLGVDNKKSLIMEGLSPFPKDSDPHVAAHDAYSKYKSSGSTYGVSSHTIEDNWYCNY